MAVRKGPSVATHCKQGHPLSGNNLLVGSKQRICRICKKTREDKYRLSEHGKTANRLRAKKFRLTHAEELQVYRKVRRQKAQKLVDTLKSSPCMDCKISFPTCAMDFDHIMGDKKEDISGLIDRGYSLRVLMQEIDKCELVCSNCHRVRTHQRRQSNGR